MSKASTLDYVKKYTMIIVLILVTGLFTWGTGGNLLLPDNVSNIISQNAYVFILATGMLLCILTGGNIDLSVGSVVCFVGAVGTMLMVNFKVNMWVTILVMFLLGSLIGSFQGFWIAYVRIPPFIVTLAGMFAFRGLSNVILKGMTVSLHKQETFLQIFGGGANCFVPDFIGSVSLPAFLGGGTLNMTCIVAGVLATAIYIFLQIKRQTNRIKKNLETENATWVKIQIILVSIVLLAFSFRLAQSKGIPSVLVIVLVVVLIYSYITSNTTVGRYFYAVGGNEKATKLSGINTNKVFFLAYANMGFLAALAGMLAIARSVGANPQIGDNFEMDAIGSCFIGGASAYGGIGTVPGVIVGAVLMGVINLGMSLMGVDTNLQKVVKGGVLLAAVIFDVVSKRGGKLIVKN